MSVAGRQTLSVGSRGTEGERRRRSPGARLAKKSDNDYEEQEKTHHAVADIFERLPGSTLGDEVPEGLAN
jgi:hypothetical protein